MERRFDPNIRLIRACLNRRKTTWSPCQGLLPNGEWLQSSDGSAQDQSMNVMGSYLKKELESGLSYKIVNKSVWLRAAGLWWYMRALQRFSVWTFEDVEVDLPSYVFTASRFMTWRMMWYSSEMPFPPSMSLACLEISRALPQLFLFNIEIISGTALLVQQYIH